MSVSAEEIAHATDLFADLGEISTRKMMGGLCLYHRGVIFAIIHHELGLMIKGAGAFIDRLEEMGCIRWRHIRKDGKPAAMPYWTLPEEAQDDPQAACALAREALAFLE